MVQISHETREQTEQRLRRVIAQTKFIVYENSYAFEEFPLDLFPSGVSADALALVRDSEVWSQLVPSNDLDKELFLVFSFHFEGCPDNSGFVGWLASYLKQSLGTGVFVTCGQNSNRGGIFDYWGCPLALGRQAVEEVQQLMAQGKSLIGEV